MAIPDPKIFKMNTAPPTIKVGALKIGTGYGSNMIKVLSALEAYWDNRNQSQLFKEQLLYNLWKVSNNWLELKSGKAQKADASALFFRRKEHVENLRDEALAELEQASDRVAAALRNYQAHKQNGVVGHQLKGLANGYHLEREHYLQGNKTSGSTISGTNVSGKCRFDANSSRLEGTKAQKILKKGYGNLTLKDTQTLQRLFPDMPPVVYMNKIERLKYILSFVDGRICDSGGHPFEMTERESFKKNLRVAPYVMDKYGNLYTDIDYWKQKDYLAQDVAGRYQTKSTNQFNHSSFLAGAEVVCAGTLHIGWNNRSQSSSPGALSAIDNCSGHYKPSRENLLNCLDVLRSYGVNIELTRVGDWSLRGGEEPVFYWGRDYLPNQNPWVDENQAPNPFGPLGGHRFKSPPIAPCL